MPYYETSEEWLQQSSLLLQARPTTTRITTKYKILPLSHRKSRSRRGVPDSSETPVDPSNREANPSAAAASLASGPTATLTLKTFDPVSGACLKYRTNKAAEVGRLIASLGRLGRIMAALPEEAEPADIALTDAPEDSAPVALKTEESKPVQTGSGGATAGKKKKKGKK